MIRQHPLSTITLLGGWREGHLASKIITSANPKSICGCPLGTQPQPMWSSQTRSHIHKNRRLATKSKIISISNIFQTETVFTI